MRLVLASLFLTLGVSQAAALCDAVSTTVLSCTTGRGTKQLDVCITGDRVTYRFGPHTAPDLRLSAPIKEVAHQPWPGIGRAIWESTTFRNGAFSYEVYGAYDKIDQTSNGGVTVTEQGREIAALTCDSGTAELGLFALSDAKRAGRRSTNSPMMWPDGLPGRGMGC